MSEKPVRIFVVNTLITGLFMAAYYKQEEMRDKNIRDVCIILYPNNSDNYMRKFIEASKKIARIISEEIIIFFEPYSDYVPMSFKNMHQDRLKKKEYLAAVKELCEKNNIDIGLIKEIYHSNRTFHQYLKYLNSRSKLIGFEHGISDTRSFLLEDIVLNRLKNNAKCILGRLFFIFYAYAQNDNTEVSLLAPEIKKVNKKDSIKYIYPQYVKEVANSIADNDFNDKSFLNKNNSIAIILNSDGFDLTKKKEARLKFHSDFANYILGRIKILSPQVNTIIFKPRSFDGVLDEDFARVKDELINYFNGYKVFFFDEITKTNYPVEVYIDIIRPKVIFGDVSSGLFYSKALMPEIETYDYNKYVLNYELQHFGSSIPDYKWINAVFFNRYQNIFKDVLPERI